MGGLSVLKAASIITMNPAQPRAEAVLMDADSGEIVAVGSLAQCRAQAPDAPVSDLGSSVLMPGFIQAHDHPVPAAVLSTLVAPALLTGGPSEIAALVRVAVRELRRELQPALSLEAAALTALPESRRNVG